MDRSQYVVCDRLEFCRNESAEIGKIRQTGKEISGFEQKKRGVESRTWKNLIKIGAQFSSVGVYGGSTRLV